MQGFQPKPNGIRDLRMLIFELTLAPGESRELHYANAIAGDKSEAIESFERIQEGFHRLAPRE